MTEEIEEVPQGAGQDVDNEPEVESATPPDPQDEARQQREMEARALGWKSPDEWRGDLPRGYIDDPERYLEWAKNLTPFKHLKTDMERKLEKQAEQLRRIEQAAQRQIERERAQNEANLRAIQAAKAQARESQDMDSYVALDRREAELRAQATDQPPQQQQQPEMSPEDRAEFETWAARNSDWLVPGHPNERSEAAVQAFNEATARGITTIKGQLAFVDRQLELKFPAKPAEPDPVSRFDSALSGGSGNRSGFSKLPKSARDTFNRFYENGVYGDMDKAEAQKTYAEDYNAA